MLSWTAELDELPTENNTLTPSAYKVNRSRHFTESN